MSEHVRRTSSRYTNSNNNGTSATLQTQRQINPSGSTLTSYGKKLFKTCEKNVKSQ